VTLNKAGNIDDAELSSVLGTESKCQISTPCDISGDLAVSRSNGW